MPDYKQLYFQLAAKVTDAIDILVEAQQQGENNYIQEETHVILLKKPEQEKDQNK
ncbi:hypothetical protein LPY66_05240 [Dehalobacter sp. DCM]|uniref:hypothetical protein n=1 Tax=Dehalobacter sp. DCM TaxID=2907827 RepID=UPI0030821FAC|nr:hypothetical protein LPY66_05240 [Dehalobacter sp. DCM]